MKKSIIMFYFCLSGFLFAENRTILSSDTVKIGEPLSIRIQLEGNPAVKIIRQSFRGNGVVATYSGMEQSTSIVNMAVSRHKIIRYVIIPDRPGKFAIPEIAVEVDGSIYRTPPANFTVLNEKYTGRPAAGFDRLFDSMSGVDPGNIKIRFSVTEKDIYEGQTIAGYYTLLFDGRMRPGFERDPSAPLDFPYLKTETQKGINIDIPDRVVFEGKEYNTAPYEQEVFILTPLRAGTYSIGKVDFLVSTGMFGRPLRVASEPVTINVKKLPASGQAQETGSYDMNVSLDNNRFYAGESAVFRVKIFGEGSGVFIKNPAASVCRNLKCSATLIDDRKDTKFSLLKSGSYGYQSNLEFVYSISAPEAGLLKLPPVTLEYFNLYEKKYMTLSAEIPEIEVLPAREAVIHQDKSWNISWKWLILFPLAGAVLFIYRKIRNSAADLSQLVELDTLIGRKKGHLLKNYLLDNTGEEQAVNRIIKLKNKYMEKPLEEIYYLAGHEKNELLNDAIILLKGMKNGRKR